MSDLAEKLKHTYQSPDDDEEPQDSQESDVDMETPRKTKGKSQANSKTKVKSKGTKEQSTKEQSTQEIHKKKNFETKKVSKDQEKDKVKDSSKKRKMPPKRDPNAPPAKRFSLNRPRDYLDLLRYWAFWQTQEEGKHKKAAALKQAVDDGDADSVETLELAVQKYEKTLELLAMRRREVLEQMNLIKDLERVQCPEKHKIIQTLSACFHDSEKAKEKQKATSNDQGPGPEVANGCEPDPEVSVLGSGAT